MLSDCIDSVELRALASGNKRRQTRVDSSSLVRKFKRLAEIIAGDSGNSGEPSVGLTIDVRFENGSEGLPCVDIKLDGQLNLECQRCLRAYGFPVNLESRLTILSSDEQSSQIVEPFDSVVMTTEGLNLATIIEDEILSALPMAPIHESIADCTGIGDASYETKNEAVKPNRPFANLASIMDVVGKDRID
jgi:uncharacterized protein